ncbi:hypothetical protein TH53_23705 [Pedobacter lusitanus]|uniref:Outer membrane protein beta-barrel domain-containing protein n=1 Tax=Pedobacter lusitanus TaxID=1503925 RepID=A0A0D0EZV6_9SPHI|nr:hypothetical protein TH53_23705 [Pedobacter lusitanus]
MSKKNKLSFYLNTNFSNPKRSDVGTAYRRFITQDGTTYFDENSNSFSRKKNYSFLGGAEYLIDKKNIIQLTVNGYLGRNKSLFSSETVVSDEQYKRDSLFKTFNTTSVNTQRLGGNVNYISKKLLMNGDVVFNYDYLRFSSKRELTNISQFYTNDLINTRNEQNLTINPLDIDINILSLDYTKEIDSTQSVEAGFRSSFVENKNRSEFNDFLNGGYVFNQTKSDHFIYNENINSVYGSWSKKWNTWSIKAGLRFENTHVKGNSLASNLVNNRTLSQFFPSFFAQKKVGENEYYFSYGKRIQRPNYQSLNPFRFYYGPYNYTVGNPYLNPEITNQFEIGAVLPRIISLSAGFSRTRDVIQSEYTTQDDITKITTSSTINLSRYDRYFLSANAEQSVNSWYKVSESLDSYIDIYHPDIENIKITRSQPAFDFNLTNAFTFDKYLVQLQGSFSSVFIDAQTTYKPSGYVNLAIKRSLFGKKAFLFLRMTDLFKTQYSRGAVDFQNQFF